MSGIYVHIPYCKVKCHYCDFHFSINNSNANDMVNAICNEIEQRKSYLSNPIQTIYFGGGTPSLLDPEDLGRVLNSVHKHLRVSEAFEQTIECNPDDLNAERIQDLKKLDFNRFSIGIQSFDDEVLKMMGRAHVASEAKKSVQLAQDAGFENITIDLIYGVPDKGEAYWKGQLKQAMALNVPHISSYCLTIEPNTVFAHQLKKGSLEMPSDETALSQFKIMINQLDQDGFEHYEISNFAKEGFISQHNSAYWMGKAYLGIGPSAHSFDGETRSWNIANNHRYIKGIENREDVSEREVLSSCEKFNDYVLTRLRTKWGIDLNDIERFAEGQHLEEFYKEIKKHLDLENIIQFDNNISLSQKGKFIADGIASDLFL